MNIEMQHIEVFDKPDAGRFEARYHDETLGYLTYEISGGVMRLPHTYVTPPARGQSIAALLVQAALESARSRQLSVDPICWYVAVFLRRNPEYQDLVAGSARIAKSS